jgi:hypothetical protein
MPEKLMQLDVRAAAARSRKMTLLTKSCLLPAFGLLLALPSLAQQNVNIQTGLPIGFSTVTLHLHGQPITIYQFAVSLYRMNTPPPWPIGLWLYSYVQADADDGGSKSTWGQSRWCEWWFYEGPSRIITRPSAFSLRMPPPSITGGKPVLLSVTLRKQYQIMTRSFVSGPTMPLLSTEGVKHAGHEGI